MVMGLLILLCFRVYLLRVAESTTTRLLIMSTRKPGSGGGTKTITSIFFRPRFVYRSRFYVGREEEKKTSVSECTYISVLYRWFLHTSIAGCRALLFYVGNQRIRYTIIGMFYSIGRRLGEERVGRNEKHFSVLTIYPFSLFVFEL